MQHINFRPATGNSQILEPFPGGLFTVRIENALAGPAAGHLSVSLQSGGTWQGTFNARAGIESYRVWKVVEIATHSHGQQVNGTVAIKHPMVPFHFRVWRGPSGKLMWSSPNESAVEWIDKPKRWVGGGVYTPLPVPRLEESHGLAG